MKNRVGTLLFCIGLALAPVSAEQIYLRNRLYKGPVQGSGKSVKVGLNAFASTMGLKVSQQGGATFVHPHEVTGNDFGVENDPGGVYVVGKRIQAEPGPGGEMMISLYEAAEAAGFRVQANAQLGTIDVVKVPPQTGQATAQPEPEEEVAVAEGGANPRKAVKRGTSPGSSADGLRVLTPIPPRLINKPGMAVNVEQCLVPGRHNLVVFGAKW